VALHRRELAWDGCLNVRDLGGHRTADGGETRYGAIVRADSVRQLTDAGWTALVDYGVRTIVDLRMEQERDADPPAKLPVEVVHVPFLVDDPEALAEAEAVGAAAPDDTTATRDVYLVFLERFNANVANAIRVVARAPEGGVAIHCQGGKDRTGLISALLLRLAGVGEEEIGADYALSAERLQARHAVWFDEAETHEERERIRRLSECAAESMIGVLGEVERRRGSVDAYLRAGGLADDDLRVARARLRG
jgi:protein tyrosine/serine phosphatase